MHAVLQQPECFGHLWEISDRVFSLSQIYVRDEPYKIKLSKDNTDFKNHMPVVKLNKSTIDTLPLCDRGQVLYFDTEIKGFGLCVGKSAKTYFAQGTVNHKRIRCAIGRHGVFTPEQARNEAKLHLADMMRGIDPHKKSENEHACQITVAQAIKEYISDRKSLKTVSADGYRRHLALYVPDWMNKPLASIGKKDILDRHRSLGETKGPCAANKTMRVLRSLYNYTHAKYGNIPDNPTRYLTLLKGWYRQERRKTYIKSNDIAKWHFGVQQIVNPAIRDFLLLLLFTGLRKSEATRMRWENVDFENRAFTVKMTKNGDDHTLPMSSYLFEFFTRRKMATGISPWVFPGHGDDGHFTEPKKAVKFVTKLTGVTYSLHDLRRTFITIAESLDIPHYALKKLLNHRSGDITASYIMIDLDRLREPMDRVSQRILELLST